MSSPTVRLVLLVDDGARREFGALIVKRPNRSLPIPRCRWTASDGYVPGRRDVLVHRDGITIDTSGTSRLMTVAAKMLPDLNATRIDRIWVDTTRDVQTATASVFGMILIPDRLNMAQSIAAGRALAEAASGCDRGGHCCAASQPAGRNDRSSSHARKTGRVRPVACQAGARKRLGTDVRLQARIRGARSAALAEATPGHCREGRVIQPRIEIQGKTREQESDLDSDQRATRVF